MTPAAAEKPPMERQRWTAAQCLAAGQGLAAAAAFASMPVAELRRLDAQDADFRELRAWEADRAAEPPEPWARRMELLTRQAIERALADGRVSTVNALLRVGLALPSLVASPGGRAAAQRALCGRLTEDDEAEDDDSDGDLEQNDDPDAWPAETPVVEADSEKEAERRRLLAKVEHAGLRKMVVGGTLNDLELFHAVGDPDPTVYEQWFAKQPKPAFEPIALSDEDKAAIAHVTRHNPPWIRGEYLGFYREPVPAELFLADGIAVKGYPPPARRPASNGGVRAGADAAGPALASPMPAPPSQSAALRARVGRLLDRSAAAPARGAGPGRGGVRAQVAKMARVRRSGQPRPAPPRAAGRGDRRRDPQLAWRARDR
jgi:hypothetical protein